MPLQIDTSDPVTMEKALRIYNGKPLINSVNGKQEVMDAIFPLVKKYGGFVVCLTIDEQGIPETVEGRLAVADKIIKTAESYGIGRKDICTLDDIGQELKITKERVRQIRDAALTKMKVEALSNDEFDTYRSMR